MRDKLLHEGLLLWDQIWNSRINCFRGQFWNFVTFWDCLEYRLLLASRRWWYLIVQKSQIYLLLVLIKGQFRRLLGGRTWNMLTFPLTDQNLYFGIKRWLFLSYAFCYQQRKRSRCGAGLKGIKLAGIIPRFTSSTVQFTYITIPHCLLLETKFRTQKKKNNTMEYITIPHCLVLHDQN